MLKRSWGAKAVRLVVATALALPLGLVAATPSAQAAGSVTVTPNTGLSSGDTVTVSGTGFGTGMLGTGIGVYVRVCRQLEGAPGTAAGRHSAADCDAETQEWVSNSLIGPTAPMGSGGTFSVSMSIPSELAAGSGTIDCTEVQCGIVTRRDHEGGSSNYTYDTFTPISFSSNDEPDGDDPEGDDPDADDPDADDPDGEDPDGQDPEVEDPDGEDPDGQDPGTTPTPTAGDGELVWGLKSSFVRYVTSGPAQGQVAVDAPATQRADGTFRFPQAAGGTYAATTDLDAPFAGGVHFTGHNGALDVRLSDPQVKVSGTAGTLLLDVYATEKDSEEVTDLDDVAFATLDLSGLTPTAVDDDVTFSAVPATLTEAGARAFSGFYKAGDPLDDLTFTVELDDVTGLDPPTEGADSVTCVAGQVAAGSNVEVCGSGFIAGEQVQVVLHSTPSQIAVVTAGADGSVKATVTIPAATRAGSHHIELVGITSGRTIASAAFTVTAPAAAVAAAPSQSGATLPTTGSTSVDLAMAAFVLLLIGANFVVVAHDQRRHQEV